MSEKKSRCRAEKIPTPSTSELHDRIRALERDVETLESFVSHLFNAQKRFSVGDIVEFSRKAIEGGVAKKKNGDLLKGVVEQIGHSKLFGAEYLIVKLDGIKKLKTYHHTFFNKVGSWPKY